MPKSTYVTEHKEEPKTLLETGASAKVLLPIHPFGQDVSKITQSIEVPHIIQVKGPVLAGEGSKMDLVVPGAIQTMSLTSRGGSGANSGSGEACHVQLLRSVLFLWPMLLAWGTCVRGELSDSGRSGSGGSGSGGSGSGSLGLGGSVSGGSGSDSLGSDSSGSCGSGSGSASGSGGNGSGSASDELTLKSGRRALIVGLKTRTDLNGAAVLLLTWHSHAARWAVKCEETQECVRVQPQNLQHLSERPMETTDDKDTFEMRTRSCSTQP